MKVQDTFIVFKDGKHQILFYCGEKTYYITSNGAFGQRDTFITPINPNEAKKLIGTIICEVDKEYKNPEAC